MAPTPRILKNSAPDAKLWRAFVSPQLRSAGSGAADEAAPAGKLSGFNRTPRAGAITLVVPLPCFEAAAIKEQRISSRHRVLLAGAIEFGPTSIPCTIRNLSETGAAIEINAPLWFPEQFTLLIERDNSRRRCRIVWRREKRIGVHFEEGRPV